MNRPKASRSCSLPISSSLSVIKLTLSVMNQPENNPPSRLLALVERMEKATAVLVVGRQDIPPHPYNENAVLAVVVQKIRDGFCNGRIIAERINAAAYQTKAGKAWDKDIYSTWKRNKRVSLIFTQQYIQLG